MPHTPGPWRVGRKGAVVADHPIPEMGGSDAVEYYGGHCVAESITDRNAPIIAAAPEMLEALYMVRDANRDEPHIPPPALAVIDAAIAKAEGRS